MHHVALTESLVYNLTHASLVTLRLSLWIQVKSPIYQLQLPERIWLGFRYFYLGFVLIHPFLTVSLSIDHSLGAKWQETRGLLTSQSQVPPTAIMPYSKVLNTKCVPGALLRGWLCAASSLSFVYEWCPGAGNYIKQQKYTFPIIIGNTVEFCNYFISWK